MDNKMFCYHHVNRLRAARRMYRYYRVSAVRPQMVAQLQDELTGALIGWHMPLRMQDICRSRLPERLLKVCLPH